MFTLATGEAAVAIGGNAKDTIIVTGDNNIISLHRGGIFAFHLLDEAFRQHQMNRAPAAFYDGTRPNWANIALGHDAPRHLYAELCRFATDPSLPVQRMALILGLAGEGKTTLLMRLAWNLAEEGYPVLWRHSGLFFAARQPPVQSQRPLILCLDQADQEEHLPALAADLSEAGLPYVILASSRIHEWRNAGLEPALRRVLRYRPFPIGRLESSEVEGLLDKLGAAGKLDRLAGLPRPQQVRHFLDRLQADGQLLPALLTARAGATSFEAIVEDVLQRVRRRPDGDFLLQAYTLLSAVHRFGYPLPRPLLAQALGIPEEQVIRRVVGPLQGELLEISTAENERLYTRHPFIAACVFQISTRNQWAERRVVYQTLINTFVQVLRRRPFSYERNLLKGLAEKLKREEGPEFMALILGRVGRFTVEDAAFWETWAIFARSVKQYEQARTFFRRAVDLDPGKASIWQAWAVMESRLGNYDEARRLFERGTQAAPTDAYIWQAWASMELQRDPGCALDLLDRALQTVHARRSRAILLCTRGRALARLKRLAEAEETFRESLYLDERNWHTHYFYAHDVLEPRRLLDEACYHYQRALQLGPRKKQERESLRWALRRLGCQDT